MKKLPPWYLLALAACHRGSAEHEELTPAFPVRCGPATARTLPETRALRGSVQLAPESLSRLGAETAGRLRRLLVREGDRVSAGQVLAEVDPGPQQERSSSAAGDLLGAQATVSAAQSLVQRLEPLVARGIAAGQELEDARARLAQARAAVALRQGAAQLARRDVARTTLRAPLAGVVLRVLRGAGELVDGTAATPVLELGDPASRQFVAVATAEELRALREGQRAEVLLAGSDGAALEATVLRVAPGVEVATGLGSVRLSLPEGALPLGLPGLARVRVGEHAGALTVPEAALREREDESAEVVLCEDGHARVRTVRLGLEAEGAVEVREGLRAGDLLVLERPQGLEEGAALRVER